MLKRTLNDQILDAKFDKLNPNDLLRCATDGPGKNSGFKDYCVRYGTHCNTKTPGVIGLGAPEHCSGMAVEIENIEDTDINILWTDGLAGCLAIAIIGINEKTGTKDIFFTHASHWNHADAVSNKENPIYYARQFVDLHGPCRIVIGTDVEKLKHSGYDMTYAKRKLCKDLGCPVLCESAYATLSFFPKLGIMIKGNPATAVYQLREKNPTDFLNQLAECKEKFYSHPKPNPELLDQLQVAIQHAKNTGFSNWLLGLNEKRQNIVNYLESIRDAYIGNNIEKMTSTLYGLKLLTTECKYLQLCETLIEDRQKCAFNQEQREDLNRDNTDQRSPIRQI